MQTPRDFLLIRTDNDIKIAAIEQNINGINQTLIRIEKRLDKMDDRFDKIDDRLDKMDARFDKIDNEIKEIRKDINSDFKWTMRFIFGLSVVLIGLMLKGFHWF